MVVDPPMAARTDPFSGPGRVTLGRGALGLAFALLLTACQSPAALELRVTPVRGGPPLLVLPMAPQERFTIRYYHSVENAPIWETHSVDAQGNIFIEEERYLKYGAGMGKMPGIGRMVMRGPYEVIEDMHMATGNFVLRVGSPGVDHTVIWRGTETNLSAMAPHRAVQFSAAPLGAARALWRRWFPHPATPAREVKDE
jgi:hypothetical protein